MEKLTPGRLNLLHPVMYYDDSDTQWETKTATVEIPFSYIAQFAHSMEEREEVEHQHFSYTLPDARTSGHCTITLSNTPLPEDVHLFSNPESIFGSEITLDATNPTVAFEYWGYSLLSPAQDYTVSGNITITYDYLVPIPNINF